MRYLLASVILLASASAAFGEHYAPAVYRPVEMSQNEVRPLLLPMRTARAEMIPPTPDTTKQTPPESPNDPDAVKKSLLWMNF